MFRSMTLVAAMFAATPVLADEVVLVGPPADIGLVAEATPVATVSAVSGQAQRWDAESGKWCAIGVGEQIMMDAVIRTGVRSQVTIEVDGQPVQIGSISRMTVASAVSSANDVRSTLALDRRDIDGRLARESYRSFTVVTPQPTLGVQRVVGGPEGAPPIDRFTIPNSPRSLPYRGQR